MTENPALVEAMARAMCANKAFGPEGCASECRARRECRGWRYEDYLPPARVALTAYRTFTQDDGK